VLIVNDTCGYIDGMKRKTLSSAYTPMSTGLYALDIYNYRNSYPTTSVYNYIDDIKLIPQNPDLTITEGNISISAGRLVKVTLDAGVSHAGEDYFLLASFGSYPGFNLDGIHVPLNRDYFFRLSYRMANSAMFQNSMGVLNSSGMAVVWFSTMGPVDPQYLGKQIYMAYLLTSGPATRPVTYASLPIMLSFIP
jgi:hypothetical protein